MQSKTTNKVLAAILSVILMLQLGMPAVYAEGSIPGQEAKTITAFGELAEDEKNITVPTGTPEEELPLPETVTAAVYGKAMAPAASIYLDGKLYADGGDASGGLDLASSTPTEETYYRAGNGYVLFIPSQGEIPAELVLNNASMNIPEAGEAEEAELILLPAGTVTMRISGENVLTVYAEYAAGICSDKYNPTNLTITSSDHGTLEISTIGSEGSGALGGFDGELASLTIGGNASVTATAWGESSAGTVLEGNLTVENSAKFVSRGEMSDLIAYGEPFVIENFNGIAVFSNSKAFSSEIVVYGDCYLSHVLSISPIGSFNNGEVIANVYLKVTSGSTLTIPTGKTLTITDLANLTNSGAIVNNGTIILPDTSDEAAIRALNLTGSGVVQVGSQYYTNGGIAVIVISGGLDLTGGDHSGATLENDGYAWDSTTNTLTLGSACVTGSLTLPCNTSVTIITSSNSSISGDIGAASDSNGYNYPMSLTFTGTAPLTINGGISGGVNNDTVTVQGGAQVTVYGSVFLGGSGGAEGTLNVGGTGTILNINAPYGYGVMCDTINLGSGASLNVNSDSVGVQALSGGVSITDGSTLTSGCDYGVYIIGGKLTVDSNSKLVTNGALAPFCVVDTTSAKTQRDTVSLPGIPSGTAITSVTGANRGYNYWSLVPTGGSLGVSNDNNDIATLSGAKIGTLTFVKPTDTGGSGGGSGSGSGRGSVSRSSNVSYTLAFETNGGSAIGKLVKVSGTAVGLSAFIPTREGYEFAGWYSDVALTTRVTGITLTKNTTVYAKWTAKTAQSENPFTDVSDSDYYHDAVLWAVKKGITNGTTGITFSPEMICSRAQAVTFLWRAVGSPEPTAANCPFTDVNKADYYYKAVLWAIEKGITKGTSVTTFSPDDTVTRSQSMAFLWRATGEAATASANPFVDVIKDAYYYNAVLWSVEKGITKGTSASSFSPDGGCTRGHIVTFLYRYMEK